MTPKQAYKKVISVVKKEKTSIRKFCESRGVSHSTVSKWSKKDKGSVYDSILDRLIGKRK